MRCAVIYRPKNPPPPELMPELMQRLGGWVNEYRSSMSTMEFFVGGGGFGVLDVADSGDLQRMIAAHPFTPFADVEIRPVVEPGEAMQILQEVFAQAAAGS
jgi:muconolactone delta-isomerase